MASNPIKSKNGNKIANKRVEIILNSYLCGQLLEHARKILFTLKENTTEYKCQTVT
jgi:hypothetical protein